MKNILSEEVDNEDVDDGVAPFSIVSRSNVVDDDDDTVEPTLESGVVKASTRLLLLHIAKVARSATNILHIIVTTALWRDNLTKENQIITTIEDWLLINKIFIEMK